MIEQEYLNDRLEDQINWYDKKSSQAQSIYKSLKLYEIIVATLIPIIAGFGEDIVPIPLTVGLLGASIAIVSAYVSLNQFQENWIKYRTTCESLKHEKFLFLSNATPYVDVNRYPLLVQRVEMLISKENSTWSEHTQTSLDKFDAQKSTD